MAMTPAHREALMKQVTVKRLNLQLSSSHIAIGRSMGRERRRERGLSDY